MNQSTEQYEKNIKVSINRARKQIRRLLECNFPDQYSFMTLTFSTSNEIDTTDIDCCNDMFRKFKKRLDYHLEKMILPKFKYIGVIEFQDESREGAIHYHIVCNLTAVSTKKLEELWSYGWVHKTNITSDVVN
ncbi:rolling circle replication-associated protein [Siminovitchia fortis]|uniref:rolling circle replication-associated protein n=1 Tax=Siminovitchia fortis TaxID=254758 RepID=UPI0011A9CFC4|nr:hypothetical protein [Siminovitchia fortis]